MKWLICLAVALTTAACGDDDGGPRLDAAAEDDAGGHDDASLADSGATDADTDAANATCGSLSGRTDTCDTCLRDSCCFSLTACGNDAACAALVQCLRGCDDPDASTDCMGACVTAHSVPLTYNPLVICQANECADECPFSSP